jgi:hypothetical protein
MSGVQAEPANSSATAVACLPKSEFISVEAFRLAVVSSAARPHP